jgi:NCAIR mutase (PurE)-related protein
MTLPSPALMELMSKVMDGDASFEQLVDQMRVDQPNVLGNQAPASNGAHMQQVPGATVDLGRQSRCGFGEVIYGEGKSFELIGKIIQTQLEAGQSSLVTRIESGVAFQVRQSFQFAQHNPVAHTLRVANTEVLPAESFTLNDSTTTHQAAVVSAGSTDVRVAEEAMETLAWMGVPFQRFDDVGVAGPQRLNAVVPDLQRASAVVVVAGMEGALSSVVAGHLNCPVFALPTSVGYGAAFNGLTPLMGMLTSCTANVAVVNIDAGFKGGYMAGLVIDQLIRNSNQPPVTVPQQETVEV